MHTFFIEYRDPLFSVIIFFTLIFVIAFFSYWFGRYKKREDSKYLDKFLQGFRLLPSHDELKILISSGELSEKSWLLLAQSYFKNGDYEKSIEIYNELLKVGTKSHSRDTMFLLGRTYFKAGFLERARKIFLEILKNNPRTPQALSYLLLVYEYMRNYKAALEVLEPLDALQKETMNDAAYLQSLMLINEGETSSVEKANALLEIYKSTNILTYMVFEYLFRVDAKLAWKNFDTSKSEQLSELLWRLDAKKLDLDIIAQNGYLRELFTARGDVKLASKSLVFEFDILIKLEGKSNVTLAFEYVCDSCKQTSPFVFNRCTSCHSIDTARVELSLTKDYYRNLVEENNSFQ